MRGWKTLTTTNFRDHFEQITRNRNGKFNGEDY
jgi:hypothetical protein